MIKINFLACALTMLLAATAAAEVRAEPTAYLDEGEFLAAVSALGVAVPQEGFEDDGVWGAVRTSVTDGVHAASSVTSLGLVWSANNLSSEITTSTGAARSGDYGVYSYPHGSYTDPDPGTDCYIPGDCGDGLRGRPEEGLILAVGGWVRTNTPFAKIGLYLADYPLHPIDFGASCDPPGSDNCSDNAIIGTSPTFFGVVDPAGFDRFEFRELEGKLELGGGDIKYIFADDFSFAISGGQLIYSNGFE